MAKNFSVPRNNDTAAEAETNLLTTKTQNARVAKAADRLALERRAQSLGGIVYDAKVPAASEIYQRAGRLPSAAQLPKTRFTI